MSNRAVLVALAVSLPTALGAQTPTRSTADSVRRAVQGFYDWYVPRSARPGAQEMVMVAATNGPVPFRSELVRWLRIDSTARARAQPEIDGLDGDPYLNSQDPCDQYRVQSVRRHGRSFLVAVVGSGGCLSRASPDAVVELQRHDGRFIIVEFRDPQRQQEGLIPLLKRLHPTAR